MSEIFTEEEVRNLRLVRNFSQCGSFAVVDKLKATSHLIRACIMACDSIEDMTDRNAIASLLGEIQENVATCAGYLKSLKSPSDRHSS